MKKKHESTIRTSTPSDTPQTRKPVIEALRRETRANTAAFRVVHSKGMAALKRGDYAVLGEAVVEERAIIEKLISTQRSEHRHTRRRR
jgi:hypothetical protein